MSEFIIGLTGGIAAGKSEIGKRFEAYGITVTDADTIARQIVMPGRPALQRIVEHFGQDILQADGALDRRKLRERIFDAPQARHILESITHPMIRLELEQACRDAAGPYAIASIPLLTEAHGRLGYPWLDRVLVVDTPETVQRERLMRRDDIDGELADRMIAAQATRKQRLALADDIIVNDGSSEQLDLAIAALDARYRSLAGS
ncbi:MAG: dephospho-CoA kinase [Xanthomonadaceae bacterium]|jgi:dephospho-CoA kinase|nr:dephospho-CoA kinase [Xanthomonadaceae bacterium]